MATKKYKLMPFKIEWQKKEENNVRIKVSKVTADIIERVQGHVAERKAKKGNVDQYISWYDDLVPKTWLRHVNARKSDVIVVVR